MTNPLTFELLDYSVEGYPDKPCAGEECVFKKCCKKYKKKGKFCKKCPKR